MADGDNDNDDDDNDDNNNYNKLWPFISTPIEIIILFNAMNPHCMKLTKFS